MIESRLSYLFIIRIRNKKFFPFSGIQYIYMCEYSADSGKRKGLFLARCNRGKITYRVYVGRAYPRVPMPGWSRRQRFIGAPCNCAGDVAYMAMSRASGFLITDWRRSRCSRHRHMVLAPTTARRVLLSFPYLDPCSIVESASRRRTATNTHNKTRSKATPASLLRRTATSLDPTVRSPYMDVMLSLVPSPCDTFPIG